VKDYVLEAQVVHALQGVSVTIQGGEMVTVMGPSGSGKSAAPSRSAPACPAMKVPTE
jgi:ABC-type lipoprotein export system ATPase subunit